MSEKITIDKNGELVVPNNPIIPYIEGDGIGPEVWSAAKFVMDSAVEKAYQGKKQIDWIEVYAGEKAFNKFSKWLPDETIESFKKHLIGIKGPLTTPIGGGIRSLNVALRQKLDLYVCLRPVKYYGGIETPMRRPEKVDMIIFRENTEDIYTGIEFKAGSEDNRKLWEFMKDEFPDQFEKIRFGTLEKTNEFLRSAGLPEEDMVEIGFGIKVMTKTGSQRLMIAALNYAIAQKRKSITIVHKGNIMKFTSGSFRDWSYDIAEKLYPEHVYTWRQYEKTKEAKGKESADTEMNNALWLGRILVKEAIADNALQQVLTNPESFDILATGNLNGDYLSDAVAAQVGGIGIAPGGNINYITGHAIFEATHGTAPTFAGLNKANPSSLILSGMMMMQYLGWGEAANMIDQGVRRAIDSKHVTFDFANQMLGATEVSTSQFAEEIVKNLI